MSLEKEKAEVVVSTTSILSRKTSSVAAFPAQENLHAIISDEYNHALSKKVTRKCDIRVVPMLGLLYLTALLDRVNIGNVRLLGFEKDLHMPSNGYSATIWTFYITYVLFEVPSNLLLTWTKCRPGIWMGTLVFMFGILTMCQGFVQNAGSLYACRILMGIFEGGLVPAAALLMGQYYRKSEFGLRYAFFISFASTGGAFSSFLAVAINYLDGTQGLAGWRWVFILEGLLSTLLGFIALFIVPEFPENATFLAPDEKALLLQRLEIERGVERSDMQNFNLIASLFNWKTWMSSLAFFAADVTVASVAAFAPTILREMGWSATEANLLNIPILLFGIVMFIIPAYWAGRVGVHYPFLIAGFVITSIGWIIELAYPPSRGVRYFGLFIVLAGTSVVFPILILSLNKNTVGVPQKAVAVAIQVGFANCANFVSSNVFITSEAPRYPTAYRTVLALTLVGLVAVIGNALLLQAENKRMDEKEAARVTTGLDFEGPEGLRFRNTL